MNSYQSIDHLCLEQWYQDAVNQLEPTPVGEDPIYENEFSVIKHQLGNLQGTDYKVLLQASTDILHNKSKDLRVAGYATLSLAKLKGVHGLATGLTLCCELLSRFEDSVHPVSTKKRNNILNWFSEQQKKLVRFIEEDILTCKVDHVKQLKEALNAYESQFRQKIDASLGSLQDVAKLVDKRLDVINREEQAEAKQLSQASSQPENQALTSSGVQSTGTGHSILNGEEKSRISLPNPINLQSDDAFLRLARDLLNYLRETEDYERMVALSRSIRWASQPLPLSENGKTRIPPIRKTAMAEIELLMQQEKWLDAFLKSEAIFMEGASHLYLDIQYLSAKAARKMGKLGLAKLIEGQFKLFLQKLPEIVQLKNSEGEPFLSATTHSWIEELQQASSPEVSNVNNKWIDIELKAKKIAEENDLAASLSYIASVGATNALDKIEQSLIQAKLCLNHGRTDIALSLLSSLEEKVKQHQLDTWAPSLAMQVWRYYERAIQGSSMDDTEKSSLSEQIKLKLFSTQPELAAQWY
jgi:type VI secretion system protein VasJ